MDNVTAKLDQLTELVESARSMPMSASCVVNRAEVLELVEDVRSLLPAAFAQAQHLLADRDAVVDEGRAEAARLVAAAAAERTRMLSREALVADAQAEADRLLEEARGSADAMRAEVEDYVDGKLANFEVVLGKTLTAVERGRQKLSGRHELDALGESPETHQTPLP